MPTFSIFESFFFLMLATTFVLILLLVYHFKKRVSKVEEKNDSLFTIVKSLAEELKQYKSSSNDFVFSKNLDNDFNPNKFINLDDNEDLIQNEIHLNNLSNTRIIKENEVNEIYDDNLDEDDIDEDEDNVSDMDDDDIDEDNVSDMDDDMNDDMDDDMNDDIDDDMDDNYDDDADDEDNNEENDKAFAENSINSDDTVEKITIPKNVKKLPISYENDSIEDNDSNKDDTNKEDYKNLTLTVLKQLVISRGLATNTSKIRKNDLIKLLEDNDKDDN